MLPAEMEEEYELRGLSGSGADGLVYKAVHRASGQPVAVKEFPGGSSPFSKVLQELSFLFSARHANLVRCLNLLYGGYGKSYLVMEYASGGSLRDFLNRREEVSAGEALEAVEQILEGLAHLHTQGITHCDLKPENILCFPEKKATPSNGLDGITLKIADFGVSVWAWRRGDGPKPGSPAYMAPEQFYDNVRPASDLYSVGVILFELCTGKHLFQGDSTQLFSLHLNCQPDLGRLNDPLVKQMCQALLEKDPNRRPEDGEAALRLLHSLRGKGRLRAVPVKPTEPRQPAAWARPRQPRFKAPSPGATGCFELPNGDFLLAHRSGTDLVNSTQRRLSPNRIPYPVLAASQPTSDQSVYLATPNWIGHLTKNSQWTPLFRPLTRVTALDYCEETRMLLTADNSKVTLGTTYGDVILSLPVANYYLSPSLAVSIKTVCATSGPSSPSCLVCRLDVGASSHSFVPLPAPSLACTLVDDTPVVLTFPTDNSGEPLLLRLDQDMQWQTVSSIPSGLLGARFQGELLVARYESQVLVTRWDGKDTVAYPATATPVDAVWNFHSRSLAVIQETTEPPFEELVVHGGASEQEIAS